MLALIGLASLLLLDAQRASRNAVVVAGRVGGDDGLRFVVRRHGDGVVWQVVGRPAVASEDVASALRDVFESTLASNPTAGVRVVGLKRGVVQWTASAQQDGDAWRYDARSEVEGGSGCFGKPGCETRGASATRAQAVTAALEVLGVWP